MEKSIVKVSNLSHRYNVQWAIKDINFEINRFGVVGLLGSNGAGKSTTMNIMCGVLNQTEGDVLINGINMREEPVEAKRLIGFLPQRPPLYGELNVDEYLAFAANIRMMDKKDIPGAVEYVKEKCGITHFSKRLIRNLSGGYQQRVGIAQAIIHNPLFVVLDEPTNGLDPNQIVEIRNLISDISKERCMLLSTHILTEVQATCDRIMMIENGTLIFSGTLDEFDNYIEPNSVVVRFENHPPAGALEAIRGVSRVETMEDAASKYRIYFEGDKDIARRMVQISVEKGWELSEIVLERSSMDEIFAQLSNKSKRK